MRNLLKDHRRVPPARKPPIYLISWAGYPNFGDELIAGTWVNYLAKVAPTTDVWLDVREPGTVTALLRGIHPRLHVVNTVFRALHDVEHGSGRSMRSLIEDLGSPKYDAGLLALREASTVHLLGGGVLHRDWATNLHIVEAMRAVRDISGARLFATGQGLMPFAGDPLTDLDHLSVRDRPSAQAAGVPMGFDDAFLLAEDARHARALGLLAGHKGDGSSARTEGTDAPSEVVVCVQSDTLAEGSFERMLDFAGAQLRRWDLPRESVRYLEAIPGDDHEGFDRLRDVVAPDGFIPFQAAWDGDFTFGPHQVWLTTRFHHHLVAALHGARGVALSGKPGYYDVKHQSVIEVGSNWSLVHAGQTSEPVALEELTAPAGFAEAVRAKRDEAKQLYGR
ncbi:polysaccharide pyruvyl transferase family protein [Kocuria marina]|uniref:polysaccharide pyruvyl transferase family protein n=1 Tax=Kocuria marina TaxID=223184 RepID=UPI000BF0149D|nr:polysaccharide pyruvyl transferase family protein [Kocuria marina]MCT1722033.1 polysaccharide pyruvyl transferase family protein [Kocuria marina]MCT1735322.1 polysaccharide pyruvyl transferase family protein [Kocuria marina]